MFGGWGAGDPAQLLQAVVADPELCPIIGSDFLWSDPDLFIYPNQIFVKAFNRIRIKTILLKSKWNPVKAL